MSKLVLLGVAQGIFKLCQHLDYSNIEFHIYGTGAEQPLVEKFVSDNPNLPITYYGEVSRSNLHIELPPYDVAIIPLLNRIYGSVPSKIEEKVNTLLKRLIWDGLQKPVIIAV